MKILVLMFEGPISNNKENRNTATSPLGRPWQKNILINMKILISMFEGPISNNNEILLLRLRRYSSKKYMAYCILKCLFYSEKCTSRSSCN